MISPVAPLDVQCKRLAAIPDGWLDGHGKGLSVVTLTAARAFLDTLAGLPSPHCYPTEDGFVRGEWSTRGRNEVSVECSEARVYLHSLHLDSDECIELEAGYTDAAGIVAVLRTLLVS